MEIRTKTRMVEEEVRTYIACDGTEFSFESECVEYEYGLVRAEAIKAANGLRIKRLDGVFPLDTNGEVEGGWWHYWFMIKNQNDWNILRKAFESDSGLEKKLENYPEVVCIEECEDEFGSDPYVFKLSDMLIQTKEFWKLFGYEVELRKSW